jgi:hypothetical protein
MFWLWAESACAIELDVTHVKTLGQTNVTGEPLKGTGQRQLAVDGQGNVIVTAYWAYPWTVLQKVGPNGRVIWEANCGGYADVPVAVADDFVYAVSPGFLLRRYALATGKMDEGWGFTWTHDKQEIRGSRKFESASGIAVTTKYVFVSDRKLKTIRRFDRDTSTEKPLTGLPAIDEPLDVAVAKSGNLLVLTEKAVLEFDPEGKAIRSPLIAALVGAQGIDVDSFTGDIYVSVGGAAGKLINQIWQYTAEGKSTGAKLGREGDFNGAWKTDVFAISTGHADFALDSSAGVWVNNGLGQLVHFTAGTEFRHDRTFTACPDYAHEVAVDSDLNVYVTQGQGQFKMNWNGEILWTSHIWPGGDPKLYPGTYVPSWPVSCAYAGKKSPLFNVVHANMLYALSPETGKLEGQILRPQLQYMMQLTSAGDQLFAGGGEADKWRIDSATHETLSKWTPFLTPPTPFKGTLMGVSPDKQRVYLWHEKRLICLDAHGKGLWYAPCASSYGRYSHAIAFLGDDVIFVNGEEHELVARDARTGKMITVIGEKDERGRPAIKAFRGIATASKDGESFLFVLSSYQIQVFEISMRK